MNLVDEQVKRYLNVLEEFVLFNRQSQLMLVERAMIAGFAALLPHPRHNDCWADFEVAIDLLYLSTDSANQDLTAIEREELYKAATARGEQLATCVIEIVNESLRQLRALNEMDGRRATADFLNHIRPLLDVTEAALMRDLIMQCNRLSCVVRHMHAGFADTNNERSQSMLAIAKCCHRIVDAALEARERGDLVTRDGRFVKPQDEAGVDESDKTNMPMAEVGTTVKPTSEPDDHAIVSVPPAMDLAELFDVSLPIPFEFFESEFQKLGLARSALKQRAVSDQIAENWIVNQRMNRMKTLCRQLRITVSEEQVRNIAKNSLVTHDSFSKGVPLSSEERVIAIEIHYQAQKTTLQKDGVFLSENDQRSEACRAIAFGEKGITTLHKIGKLFFGS